MWYPDTVGLDRVYKVYRRISEFHQQHANSGNLPLC
jgi:hypothetical protein